MQFPTTLTADQELRPCHAQLLTRALVRIIVPGLVQRAARMEPRIAGHLPDIPGLYQAIVRRRTAHGAIARMRPEQEVHRRTSAALRLAEAAVRTNVALRQAGVAQVTAAQAAAAVRAE